MPSLIPSCVETYSEKVGVFAGLELLVEQMFTDRKWELISELAVSPKRARKGRGMPIQKLSIL